MLWNCHHLKIATFYFHTTIAPFNNLLIKNVFTVTVIITFIIYFLIFDLGEFMWLSTCKMVSLLWIKSIMINNLVNMVLCFADEVNLQIIIKSCFIIYKKKLFLINKNFNYFLKSWLKSEEFNFFHVFKS